MLEDAWPQLCLSLRERRGETGFKLCQKSCGPPTTNHWHILSVCNTQWEHLQWVQKKDHAEQNHILNLFFTIAHKYHTCSCFQEPDSFLRHCCWAIWTNMPKYNWARKCGKAHEALLTGGDKLIQFNWINGCVMCNDMTTWPGAFVWRMCC